MSLISYREILFFLAFDPKVLHDLGRNPAISVLAMKHRPRSEEQDDLLRPRLVEMIDVRHELVKLAALIDWGVFEREWAGFFPSHKGRPATEPRLVAGLLYLQHAYRLSDEAVVAGRPLPDGKNPAHSRSNTSQSIKPASFTNSCRGSIKSIKRGRSRSSCSGKRGRCFMARTEIARFRPKSCKTLGSKARKNQISI
jgi:hypothetical protein